MSNIECRRVETLRLIFFRGRFIMISKPQALRSAIIFTAIMACIALSMPAVGSQNSTASLKAGILIDQPVFNNQGHELGELEDLVIKRNGSVKRALISVGGVLEVGEKLIAVRYRSLRFTGGKMIMDISKEELNNRPEFDLRKHGLFTTYHYRVYPYGMMSGPHGPYGGMIPPGYRKGWPDQEDRKPRSDAQRYDDEEQPYERPYSQHREEDMHRMHGRYNPWNRANYPARMLASVILGQTVINKQGEDVATVEDLVIDSTNNKIKQLILSYGGFLDIGDRLVAVPYRSIGFTNRGITYDITARELENQPRFEGD